MRKCHQKMKQHLPFCALLMLASNLIAQPALAETFNFVNPGGSNVDTDPGSQFTFEATGPGQVTDLNFAIHLFNNRDIPGTPVDNTMAWGDYTATLSKDGVDVLLWTGAEPGETSDLFVVLDDEATESQTLNDVLAGTSLIPPDNLFFESAVTGAPQPFTSGSASPVDPDNITTSYLSLQSLSAFDGIDLAGFWTLTLFDDIVPGEGDQLLGWQIFGTTNAEPAAVPIPAALPLLMSALGFFGFMGWRRKRIAS